MITPAKFIHGLWLIALLLTPIVLWVLPVDFFNDTGVVTCPSVMLFDLECWGCGLTRAVMHFHHWEFGEALFYNFAVVFFYPFLVWLWQKWVRAEFRYFELLRGKMA
ncbi:DUF2752 domain-containing protein [Lewinella sp. 4G2]|uniref:DUF2752 domain-containing protein n=1 Tax=Lewinella sp. 4G2 TaxID=1803372 RepID=UPI0007B4657F|nr:DUF2752 domain-containing protein [Lewinella sp. 4G2]OAV45470.1 hypothetical protein A3850_013655 [Lewinella sp. 4G2]